MKIKAIFLCLLAAFTLPCSAVTMTTAERVALSLDFGDAGYNVWDSDLSAFMIWTGTEWIGYPLGVPFTQQVGESKIGIVAGTMKQDATDRTKWYYVSNSTTRPIGVSGTYATASSSQINVVYDTAYSEVISFVVSPDDEWANVTGLSVGASVGLTNSVIKAASFLTGAFSVKWDGAAWALGNLGTSLGPTVSGYTNGTLTIYHNYCRGIGISAAPWSDGGAITNPYLPIIKNIANNYVDIQWLDVPAGSLVSAAAPTNRMTAYVVKANNGGLFMDGSNGATNFLTVDMSVSAPISFFGVFKK